MLIAQSSQNHTEFAVLRRLEFERCLRVTYERAITDNVALLKQNIIDFYNGGVPRLQTAQRSENDADISVMFPENCLRKGEKFKLTEIPYLVIP